MWARNRLGVGLSYRPGRLHRLAESIPRNWFLTPFLNTVSVIQVNSDPFGSRSGSARTNSVKYFLLCLGRAAVRTKGLTWLYPSIWTCQRGPASPTMKTTSPVPYWYMIHVAMSPILHVEGCRTLLVSIVFISVGSLWIIETRTEISSKKWLLCQKRGLRRSPKRCLVVANSTSRIFPSYRLFSVDPLCFVDRVYAKALERADYRVSVLYLFWQGWKKPGFFKFGFFGFFGFFVFFGLFCPEERVFRVFSVSRILLGASRL